MEKNTSSTFCSYFWKHICVRPDNLVKPCCRYDMGDKWDLELKEDLSEVLNSPSLQEFRANAISGQANTGCQKCYQQEEQGIFSLRNFANETFPIKGNPSTHVSPDDIEYLEYFLGDTCNLKCVTCRPQLSTKWREDYEKLGWDLEGRVERPNPQDFLRQFSNLKEIKFVGGEPLVDPNHEKVLQVLLQSNPSHMKLTYFTNNTVFPKKKIIDFWSHFKEIEIFFSVDGVNKVNDYIRFPSKWQTVDQVIDQFLQMGTGDSRFVFQFASTISLLNIWSLADIEKWYEKKKKEFPQTQIRGLTFNPLIQPDFLSLSALPGAARVNLKANDETLSERHRKILRWLEQTSQSMSVEQTAIFLNQLDSVRSLSWQDSVPELVPYLS